MNVSLRRMAFTLSSLTNKLKDIGSSLVSSVGSALFEPKTIDRNAGGLQYDVGSSYQGGRQVQTPMPNISLLSGNVGSTDVSGRNIVEIGPSGTARPFTAGGTSTTSAQQAVRNALPGLQKQALDIQAAIDRFSQKNAGQSSLSNLSYGTRSSSKRSSKPEIPPPPPTTAASGSQSLLYSSPSQASGGGSFSRLSAPTTATGGGSSYTGLLGATGGLGAQPTVSEDDRQAVESKGITSRQIQDIIDRAVQNPQVDPTAGVKNLFNQNSTQSPIVAPAIGNTINAGDINSGLETQPSTIESLTQYRDFLQNRVTELRSQLEVAQPTPPEPVVDTPTQLEFIEQSGDPFGVAQAIDDFKRTQTELVQLQTNRLEVMKDIQAINNVYSEVIEDIETNPDLPKGLARRRLTQAYDENKKIVQAKIDMLELLNQSIDDQNEVVNRAFGLVERAETREHQAKQRRMEYLEFYIDSGAIAAFDDSEIEELGFAMGVNPKGLQRVRDKILADEQRTELEYRSAGDEIIVFDKNTGKVVSRVVGQKTYKPEAPPVPEGNKQLSTTDVARLQELYPQAGINYGDTGNSAQQKITSFGNNLANQFVAAMKAEGLNRLEAEEEIQLSDTLSPEAKQTAIQMVSSFPAQSVPPQGGGSIWDSFSYFFSGSDYTQPMERGY